MFFPVNGDPDYSSVSLLLPMTGENNSTTFTDYSPTPKTITRNGDTKISTTQSKLGNGSGYFDGTGDYLAINYSSDFTIGLLDFTIEGYVYVSDTPVREFWQLFSTGYRDTSSGGGGYNFRGSSTAIILESIRNNGTVVEANGSYSFSLNQWYHVAVCRDSSGLKFFVDGNYVVSSSTFIGESLNNPNNLQTYIGSSGNLTSLSYWPHYGYLQDLRVTKGLARYTTNFTPPSSPLPIRSHIPIVQISLESSFNTIGRHGL